MKTVLVAVFAFLAMSMASAQVRIEYQTQVEGPDLAGSALNTAIQRRLLASKRISLGSDFKKPRFRLVVRTLAISDLATNVSMYEVLWLLDGEDDTIFLNSWVGYAGSDKAFEVGPDIADKVLKSLDGLRPQKPGV